MTLETDKKRIEQVEELIGYHFQQPELLLRALTHRSFSKESEGAKQNETFEFLGDAVLSLVTAEALLKKHPHAREGELSQLRANYVCEISLARAARQLGLGRFIRVGKAMRGSGSVDLSSVLADVMEAIFGAAYLDGGLEVAQTMINKLMGEVPEHVISKEKDHKSRLQELVQGKCFLTPTYRVMSVTGDDHHPIFVVEVLVNDKVLAKGEGNSKKKAAQNAAAAALETLEMLSSAELKDIIQSAS